MERKQGSKGSSLAVLFTFLLMIAVNVLSESLPLFGVSTAEIAERYPNLLSPPGVTFAIWGLIYFLLALSTLYQIGVIRKGATRVSPARLSQISTYFILSSLLNVAWIVAWHADWIGIALLILVGMLWCLANIMELLRGEVLSTREQWLLQVPFAIYFAWICVAVVANVTILLVKLGFSGFGLSESTWTVIVILLLTILALVTLVHFRLPAMGLVYLWALGGILAKHLSPQGFDASYRNVIVTLIVCIALILLVTLSLFVSNRRKVKG